MFLRERGTTFVEPTCTDPIYTVDIHGHREVFFEIFLGDGIRSDTNARLSMSCRWKQAQYLQAKTSTSTAPNAFGRLNPLSKKQIYRLKSTFRLATFKRREIPCQLRMFSADQNVPDEASMLVHIDFSLSTSCPREEVQHLKVKCSHVHCFRSKRAREANTWIHIEFSMNLSCPLLPMFSTDQNVPERQTHGFT